MLIPPNNLTMACARNPAKQTKSRLTIEERGCLESSLQAYNYLKILRPLLHTLKKVVAKQTPSSGEPTDVPLPVASKVAVVDCNLP